MKNEKEQFSGARDGEKKNVKDFIFWGVDSNIRELEDIFHAETNGALSLQTPLDEILALEGISEFAKTVAELYCHGCWLKRYLDNGDGFIDTEYIGLSNSFCMITDQISAARNLSDIEKTAVVASTANQMRGLNSGIARKKISDHVRKKLIEIEQEMKRKNSDVSSTAVYKEWRKWRQDELYKSINEDPEYLDGYSHGDAKKIFKIKDEIEASVNDPDYKINGTKREHIAPKLYERLLKEKLIPKYPTKTLNGWLDDAHNKTNGLPVAIH